MSKNLNSPHILLAAGNVNKMMMNLRGVLSESELRKIQAEVDKNAQALVDLGLSHFRFATTIPPTEWRQAISRLYYGAYNVKRAVSLRAEGSFSTDSSDHLKIGDLPRDFQDAEVYGLKLKNLREDRNLADYSHSASEADLLMTVNDAGQLVATFINDAVQYLRNRGMNI